MIPYLLLDLQLPCRNNRPLDVVKCEFKLRDGISAIEEI